MYKPSVHFSEAICSMSDSFFVTGGEYNSISVWSLGKKKPIKTERQDMTDHFVTSLVGSVKFRVVLRIQIYSAVAQLMDFCEFISTIKRREISSY